MYSNSFLSREPWKRSIRRRSATSSLAAIAIPASPMAGKFLVGKNEKVEMSP